MDKKSKLLRLYTTVNKMMAYLGAEGDINTRNFLVDDVMSALYEIDNGEYDTKVAERFINSVGHEPDQNQGDLF